MRKLSVNEIIKSVEFMCIKANYDLSSDIYGALKNASEKEESPIGKAILKDIVENADIAKKNSVPICQDTGMAVVFIELGQEVYLVDGDLNEAINEGVRRGYKKGFLRKSVVEDPLLRVNTNDNTPAIIHIEIVKGDKVKITLAPKGFGSENMSRSIMLKPSDGKKGVEDFILETVSIAGPNPCPPIVVGVGLGGTIEKAAYLAKKSLIRDINIRSEKEHIKDMEIDLLNRINNLGIGPQGLGGRTTAIAVNIETFATHIAGLPVVVNINCHATRHVQTIL
ncbi:fumarate hydratase [Helicovermis profundi]|uniref:Fumarate hydratase n=1 Tax=Helicovermis profundi TaxID=3065157 RepID=A0AAU9ES13_9FIRM|nr:fumarate hydratase [Clostridia bacterium S502]